MILRESASTTAKHVQEMKESGKSFSRWKYERSANHTHAEMSAADREHVRQELEIADDFALALRETYPDRRFVITHIPCYAVSFYQAVEEAPTDGVLPVKNHKIKSDTAWCQTCQRSRPYHLLPVPDPEFPQVEWGVCAVCKNDLIISADCEILTLIGGKD